jgi:hypothetical protein
MTTNKLILLRLYNITFGRLPFFSKILHEYLVKLLITKGKKKYFATSNFFDWSDLDA